MTIVVYNPTSRRAMFTYDAPYPPGITDLLDQHNHHYIVGHDGSVPIQRVYVEDDRTISALQDFAVTTNKTEIADDGKDEFVLTGLPDQTTVVVDGTPMGQFSGTFSMNATEEGLYVVELSHPRYLNTEIKVRAK